MKFKKYRILKPDNERDIINLNLESIDFYYPNNGNIVVGVGGQFFILTTPIEEFERDIEKQQVLKG